MIESHIDPNHAWSDAQQQLTPKALFAMLENLQWRTSGSALLEGMDELKKLRQEIDHADEEIIALLGKRMRLADDIGLVKKEHAITILQTERYNHILERALELSKAWGLSEAFIRSYFETVHWESIHHQDKVMNAEKNNN
jgi:chorismate mutase